MTRLTFVRHGQSVANAGGVTMEHALIPLSPLGVAQAACVAELLPAEPSRMLVSPYARASKGAAPSTRGRVAASKKVAGNFLTRAIAPHASPAWSGGMHPQSTDLPKGTRP